MKSKELKDVHSVGKCKHHLVTWCQSVSYHAFNRSQHYRWRFESTQKVFHLMDFRWCQNVSYFHSLVDEGTLRSYGGASRKTPHQLSGSASVPPCHWPWLPTPWWHISPPILVPIGSLFYTIYWVPISKLPGPYVPKCWTQCRCSLLSLTLAGGSFHHRH